MTPQEWTERLLDANTEYQRQLIEAEDENSRLWAVLDAIWDDFAATYPQTAKELEKEHTILKAYTIGD